MPKFTDFSSLTTIAVDDLFLVLDKSDTTDAPTGTVKTVTPPVLAARLNAIYYWQNFI